MIDPTEAPEGMIAVESKNICGSGDCHYEGSYVCPYTADNLLQCVSHNRKDRCDVVFIKKPPETEPPCYCKESLDVVKALVKELTECEEYIGVKDEETDKVLTSAYILINKLKGEKQ